LPVFVLILFFAELALFDVKAVRPVFGAPHPAFAPSGS
jgi:hypothetical protein